MPSISRRSIIKLGRTTLAITLPTGWVQYFRVKPGDKVTVVANGKLLVALDKVGKEGPDGQ